MNVYQKITDYILSELGNGIIPWQKGWVGAGRRGAVNHVTFRPYSLLNTMLLGRSGEYLTFKQAQALGGHVREGAKGRFVVFFKIIERLRSRVTENGEAQEDEASYPMLRYYHVFHVDDVEGVEPKSADWGRPLPNRAETLSGAQRTIEGYFTREGITLRHSISDEPSWNADSNTVVMPSKERFLSTEAYYACLLHQAVRSAMESTRADVATRTPGRDAADRNRDELTAELGGAMAANILGLDNATTIRDNAAYIAHWAGVISSNDRLIVTASSRAEKAVKYLLGEDDNADDRSEENGVAVSEEARAAVAQLQEQLEDVEA